MGHTHTHNHRKRTSETMANNYEQPSGKDLEMQQLPTPGAGGAGYAPPGDLNRQQQQQGGKGPQQHNPSREGGVFLEWEEICFDVKTKKKGKIKRILHGISGTLQPGEVMAVMGPSGCGKSSLMNILAHRKGKEDGVKGNVRINGNTAPSYFQRLIGYVSQDFEFFEHLTVKETMFFAAKLKLPSHAKDRLARAEELLREMDLWEVRDTKIGSSVSAPGGKSGISGKLP